jgi:glycosyltransferase involved in cell wall biosynthesis
MNITKPSFSVIIPNYNNGNTLARAIDSVLIQSYAACEIIIIDDGSSDNSKEVAEKFGHRVKYIYQSNAGVSAARNHGAKVASGNWLSFLDADDCYLPNRLESHAHWIQKDPDINFLLGDQEHRKPDGQLLHLALENCLSGRELVERHPGSINIPMLQHDFENFIADGFGEIRTLSLPRKTFLDLGGFPEDKTVGEDLYLIIRLCAASTKAGVVNLPLAVYYIYPGSVLRKDIIGAQQRFVRTLESLADKLESASTNIRRGYQKKLRDARLNLAYAFLRENHRMAAIKSVIPTILGNPSLSTARDLLSIIKGLPKKQP